MALDLASRMRPARSTAAQKEEAEDLDLLSGDELGMELDEEEERSPEKITLAEATREELEAALDALDAEEEGLEDAEGDDFDGETDDEDLI